jgi:2-succinyl-6-hydroxy-2,4-cyclohexadiene-1-carboxylate synthase
VRAPAVGSPPLLLLHGFTQSARSFRHLASALGASGAVRAIDLPGHGAAGAVRVADLEESAAFVGAVGGRGTYLGYSLGGRIALTLALADPERVERLVLVGATPGIADPAERRARLLADAALADRLDPPGGGGLDLETFLDEWLAQPLFAHLSPAAQDRDARRVNTVSGLAHSLRQNGAGTQIPSHDRLGELTMPVLLVAGAHDGKFSAIAREMGERIGENATVATIPDAGHAAPFEAPGAFLATLAAWLERTG